MKLKSILLGALCALGASSMASAQQCVDHSAVEIGLSSLRLSNVEVVEASAESRTERGAFPDGTLFSATNASCDGKSLTVRADLASDPQTAMRLTQLQGQIDRLTGCAPFDYDQADAVRMQATEAIDSGQGMEPAELFSTEACTVNLSVETGAPGRMIAVYAIEQH